MSKRKKPSGEAHVRLWRHELESAAYRALTPDARALLVEFRALYNPYAKDKPNPNRIFMSTREIMKRVGIGQRRAQAACNDLLEKGFIKLVEHGCLFGERRLRAATYALTSEPDDPRKDGAVPTKDFMRWKPAEKNNVAEMNTLRTQGSYVDPQKSPQKPPHCSRGSYVEADFQPPNVATTATQIQLPRGQGEIQGIRQWWATMQIYCALVIAACERGELS